MTGIGFRILPIPKRPDKKLVAELGRMVTPHLSDSMQRLYAGGPQLRPMHNGAKLCGPAFTVRTAPGDNLLIHKAIDTAEPGDVIVVDGGGFNDYALIGELMSARAEQRGVAGMVIWGAIRDSAELATGSFPVYASGVTHRGPYKNGPGEINVPITIGGIPVNPGDIIVGDAALLSARRHQLADQGVVVESAAVHDDHVAGLGRVDRLVDEQVVAGRGAHGKRRAAELRTVVHGAKLRSARVQSLHAVGEMGSHHPGELRDELLVGALRDGEDAKTDGSHERAP